MAAHSWGDSAWLGGVLQSESVTEAQYLPSSHLALGSTLSTTYTRKSRLTIELEDDMRLLKEQRDRTM